MGTPETYDVDESNLRRQELLDDAFAASTSALLDDLPVSDGVEVLDVGCGIGRTTQHLQDRLPTPDRIIGLDADPDLLEVARDRSTADGSVDRRCEEGDATALPFDDNRFDVVYTRFLLTHLPDSGAAVQEFRRVCQPGGLVVAQEPDLASLGTWPPSPAYETMRKVVGAVLDPRMGQKTWSLFREAGIEGPDGTEMPTVRAVVPVETDGTALRELYALSIEAAAEGLLQQGEMTPDEHESLIEEARRVEGNPDQLVAAYTVYSVWGRA